MCWMFLNKYDSLDEKEIKYFLVLWVYVKIELSGHSLVEESLNSRTYYKIDWQAIKVFDFKVLGKSIGYMVYQN